mmetsp:Transcript_21684/g.18681  ORF Transcript_21684/g.18681 Transcript_21684/m.18681 type:complete len:219 (+) Transcript_21684:708-1364(+)
MTLAMTASFSGNCLILLKVCKSHKMIVLSSLAEASLVLSLLSLKDLTASRWPSNTFKLFPVVRSQILIVLSLEDEKIFWLIESISTVSTSDVCLSKIILGVPDSTSQTLTVLSREPDAMIVSSCEMSTDHMYFLWPSSSLLHSKVLESHTLTTLSFPPVTKNLLSIESLTQTTPSLWANFLAFKSNLVSLRSQFFRFDDLRKAPWSLQPLKSALLKSV